MNATQVIQAGIEAGKWGSGDAKRMQKLLAHPATAQGLALLVPAAAIAQMNQKAVFRTVEAVDFIVTDDTNSCNQVTSALVALVMFATQKRVSFNDAHIVSGMTKEGNAVNGVSRAMLARHLPRTSTVKGTIESMVSRTVGKGGMFTALGITVKSDAHGFELCEGAQQNPLIVAYTKRLIEMCGDAFAQMVERRESRKR